MHVAATCDRLRAPRGLAGTRDGNIGLDFLASGSGHRRPLAVLDGACFSRGAHWFPSASRRLAAYHVGTEPGGSACPG